MGNNDQNNLPNFSNYSDAQIEQFVTRVIKVYKKLEQEQANSTEAITKKALEETKKLNDEHEKLTKERLQKEKEAEIAAMKDKKTNRRRVYLQKNAN